MRASNGLIEMLNCGKTTSKEIAKILGVSAATAWRIRTGKGFQYENAEKIADAFPYASPEQLFRRPFKKFEMWRVLRDTEIGVSAKKLTGKVKKSLTNKVWRNEVRSKRLRQKLYKARKRQLLRRRGRHHRQQIVHRLERYRLLEGSDRP